MAGRPRTFTEERRSVTMWLPTKLLDDLDKIAEQQSLSRTEVARRVLEKYTQFIEDAQAHMASFHRELRGA